MHKLTLKFIDNSIEQKYQKEHQSPKRKTHLKLFFLIFFVLQSIKIVIALIFKNYASLYPSLVIFGCAALSKFFDFNKECHQRVLITFMNIIFSIYVLFFDPQLDIPTMYFKGAHQMAINIVNILSTEFIDSTITIIILFSLRLFHLIQNSHSIDITSVITGVGANFGIIIIVYFYHKALRSQFLLTTIDERWEKILKQVLCNQKYILINYQTDKLQFQNITSTFSKTIQSQEEVLNFIRNAKIENISLEQYIFYKLKDHSSNFKDIMNQQINVKFDKQLMQISFSIFFGNQPTILIQTNLQKLDQPNQEIYKVCQQYLKLLVVFINIIQDKIPYDQQQFYKLANKLQLQNLMISIWNKQIISKTISLTNSLIKVQTICHPKIKIQIVGYDQKINTIPKILNLLLVFILDCSLKELITVKTEISESQVKCIKLQGKFNIQKLNYYTSKIQFYVLLICKEINAEQLCINLILNEEILQPFNNQIMPQQNFGYLYNEGQK